MNLDDLLTFMSGYVLGGRDRRRRDRLAALGPQPPSAVERKTVKLLHRLFPKEERAARLAAQAERRRVRQEEVDRQRRYRDRLRRARASARRRAWRRVLRWSVTIAALLIAVFIVALLAANRPKPPLHGTITIRQRF